MDFRSILQTGHSRLITDQIVNFVLENEHTIDELLDCLFENEPVLSQRAAWPIGKIGEAKPSLLVPYHEMLINHLQNRVHDAVKRNIMRLFSFGEVDESFRGKLYELSFGYLVKSSESIAVKVFAMQVCANIVKLYPELKEEFIQTIELHYDLGSAGYKSKVRNILKDINICRS